MGSYFETYSPATQSGGWDTSSNGEKLAIMPDTIEGGGMSGPPGVPGGPGSFKRLGQGKRGNLAARGQNVVQNISGGSGSAQSSSALDTVLASAVNASQPYMARDGGPVQDSDAGQQANRFAFSATSNEGGEEAAERGTYPFSGENPHTRDAAQDNSLALNRAPQAKQTYLDGNHGYDTVAGKEGTSGEQRYPTGDQRRGKYQPDLGPSNADTDLQSMTPAQRLAWRLAQPDPRAGQEYPMVPHLGTSIVEQTNSGSRRL
jgi:hypothetical protein